MSDAGTGGVRTQAQPAWPLRVAVVGCGAMSREFHLPVLAGHPDVRLVALVDRDETRARELARGYAVEAVFASEEALDRSVTDAVVIATPAAHHAPATLTLLARGLHVLVEKPVALNARDAAAMAEAADRHGVVLAVGLFRRLLPSTRLLRALVESELLGPPVSFDIREGSEYGWPAATLGNMRREQAGGGVLMDVGCHALDRLLFVLPGEPCLLDYEDNSLGGIESDCRVRLQVASRGRTLEGEVELSRARTLRNSFQVTCERGVLEVAGGERFKVTVHPTGLALTDAVGERPRAATIAGTWADEHDAPGYESFRAEIDDWLAAIRGGVQPELSGRSALGSARLIDECYSRASLMAEPGVHEGLVHAPIGRAGHASPSRLSREMPGPRAGARRVLVTGASGFIGCRAAEILALREGWDVRALVHNPAHASRIARLPVELVQGDLNDEQAVASAVRGCETVVHCAIGTQYGQRHRIFEVTVGGTRNLAAAALASGVRRLVHLSTMAVYGTAVSGVLDEASPVNPPQGDDYSESKLEAEQLLRRASAEGLDVVMLRPGNVYGPFSRTFTTRPLQYLAKGRLMVVDGHTPSNTVHVDNLVEAIILSLGGDGSLKGEVFVISDGDDLSWRDFYGFFAEAVGIPLLEDTLASVSASRGAARRRPSLLGALGALALSAESKSLLKRVLATDPVGKPGRWLLERFPVMETRLRAMLGMDTPVVYRRAAEADDVLRMMPRPAMLDVAKARRVLGYGPVLARGEALALTLAWARHAQILPHEVRGDTDAPAAVLV